MKAKYRLGELIEFKGEHKVVTGVIRRAAGFFYECGELEVSEADVTNVYRPRTVRAAKKAKPQKTSRAARPAAQEAVAQQ